MTYLQSLLKLFDKIKMIPAWIWKYSHNNPSLSNQ
jgi:hypothetical protein